MKWIDSLEIAICLDEKFPDMDPFSVNFVDLYDMVIKLNGFNDNKEQVGEKILEAIQMHWINEK